MAGSNKMRALNRLPYDFEDGLKIGGVDVTTLNQMSTANGAGLVGFTPVGGVSAGNVQAAIAELDTKKAALTALADTEGAALVGYDGGSVRTVLDNAKSLQDYTALRAYTGRAASVRILATGIAGFFYYDNTDTSSADNGGTVIVSSNGRRWKRVYSGEVQSTWFSPIADGVVDNTVLFLNAMRFCSENNKTLVVNGTINLIKGSVPSDQLISIYYVKGCSLLGAPGSSIKIDGKLGFDLSNVYDTRVENLTINTVNRTSTETDLESTAPGVFSSRYGTKNSAVYKNIRVNNNLTDATGAYRVGIIIGEFGSKTIDVSGVYTNGTTIAVSIKDSMFCKIEGVYATNAQTGVVLTNPVSFDIKDVELINTQEQYNHWVARLAAPARLTNGMDAVLVENGGIGVIGNIRTEWPIERAVYAQARQILMNGCSTLNGEGYKVVGSDRSNILTFAKISDCHVYLNDAYVVGTGRFRPPAFITYWSANVDFVSCTATNDSDSNFRLECFLLLGRDAHTVKNVKIYNCECVYGNSLVTVPMFTSSTAQLSAIDPIQDFYVVNGLTIHDTFIKKSQVQRTGTLLVMSDDAASSDAKANYGLKNLNIYNNSIEYNALGTRDIWTFDPRYVNTAKSENTLVNSVVYGSFFGSVITAPYDNIYLNEQKLKSDAVAGVVARLGNINLAKGSKLKFTSTFGGDVVSELDLTLSVAGPLSTASKKINIKGKGYYFYDGAINCGIGMIASGLQYYGRAVSGSKTDQVGTPPVGITVNPASIEIRGDLVPATYYETNLTLF